jgi:hypothetical protein
MRSLAAGCATFLFLGGIAFAQTQQSSSYRGFHTGMSLSETFAVGSGNLEKAQAACANPPKQLSDDEKTTLTNACAKIERTLSGLPTEWEFPKEQLRLAFDKGHVIRVSDFNGVIHLQATDAGTTCEHHPTQESWPASPF